MTDKKDVDKANREAYKKNKKKLRYILGHSELNLVLGRRQQEIMKKAFDVMWKGMDDSVAKKQTVQASGKEKSQVKEALNLLLNVVINASMKPILRDLALEFGRLAFNWNKTFGKRPDISQTAKNITAITLGNLSLTQAIGIIKALTDRLKSIQHFAPPAFDLSRHYLETLLKKSKDEKGEGKKQ